MAGTTPLLVLTGPTGSGKSALAVEIASALSAEIVNADSVQMYRGFRIGAGQPSEQQKQQCPHHLFEVLNPLARSDVAAFIDLADRTIAEINDRTFPAFVVGGTGLYIRSLLHGLVDVPAVAEEIAEQVRTELAALRAAAATLERYHESVVALLLEEDPHAAAKLHPSDTQRIVRALAVKRGAGRSLLEYQKEHAHQSVRYTALVVNLELERGELYARIDARVAQMWEQGLCEEVEALVAEYGEDIHALGALGYRHALQFIRGAWSREEAIRLMKRDTRHFAKRQMTWWRNQPQLLGWRQLESEAVPLSTAATRRKIVSNYERLAAADAAETGIVHFLRCRV